MPKPVITRYEADQTTFTGPPADLCTLKTILCKGLLFDFPHTDTASTVIKLIFLNP